MERSPPPSFPLIQESQGQAPPVAGGLRSSGSSALVKVVAPPPREAAVSLPRVVVSPPLRRLCGGRGDRCGPEPRAPAAKWNHRSLLSSTSCTASPSPLQLRQLWPNLFPCAISSPDPASSLPSSPPPSSLFPKFCHLIFGSHHLPISYSFTPLGHCILWGISFLTSALHPTIPASDLPSAPEGLHSP